MKRKFAAFLLTIGLLMSAFAGLPRTASSKLSPNALNRHASGYSATLLPMLVTNLDVDRTDDTAAATACTPAPNDCSLRGAIINANSDPGVDSIVINLQPATIYSLTLPNATQENAAATGDLDITTTLHSVTILGGGSSTIIDAAGLTSGNMHDRAFHVTGPGVTVILQDLTIRNGQAADDGSTGASTNPTAQNSTRVGGCVLNGAGIDVNLQPVIGGGTITLDGVAIESCQVLGKGDDQVNQFRQLEAWGGGLASLGVTGNVIITGSSFTGNTALGGNGGNFNNGGGSSVKGGSIYFGGGTLNIEGSRIDNSSATGGNGGNGPGNQQNGGVGGTAQGGGAWVAGTATINNTTFESCAATGGNSGTGQNGTNAGADAGGGGLFSVGSVTVTNSTFNLNSANGGDAGDSFGPDCFGAHQSGDGGAARGGAIQADAGSLIINTATLANNSANGGDGGDGGPTNVAICAQSSHGAGGLAHGGAITNTNAATVNIKHGTISGNSAQAGNTGVNQAGASLPPRLVAEGTGGGIRVGPGTVTLENTIIAGNTAANGLGDATGAPTPGPDVDGTVTSNGHNLLGNATEAGGFTGTGDLIGANPNLAPLANNGGPTETMELLPGSDAIDAGVAAGSTFDQRGMPRTVNDPGVPDEASSDGTDIGAFETEVPCILECPDDISVPNDPDECGAVVEYEEPSNEACGTVTCDYPSGSFFPVGETIVTCTSTAGPECTFKVTVTDEQPPEVTTVSPISMWPPNHQYQTFNVADLVTGVSDNCDATVGVGSVVITGVSSDEAEDAAGGGDGNTLNDIVIAGDCKSVQLRSERMGDGNGRVYTITLMVTDASGNVSTATVKVTVPHSQNGAPAVDDGPSYTVNGCP
ncbi:MAG TPA: choice-of-anchor Q domain-containing protein [Pyrinomonadaceae bacterium]